MRRGFTIIEVLAIGILISFGVIFYFRGGQPSIHQDKVIVAFGDSLTRGYGTPPGKNFVTYLSEYLKIPIINSGKTGDNTSQALVRLRTDVLDYRPDLVLLLFGGNFLLDGYNETVVYANMKTIIKSIKKNTKAKIILMGISSQVIPEYESVFERLAVEENLEGYIPNIMGGIVFRKDLRYDEIHPNDRGHKVIAERIAPVLEKVLREI